MGSTYPKPRKVSRDKRTEPIDSSRRLSAMKIPFSVGLASPPAPVIRPSSVRPSSVRPSSVRPSSVRWANGAAVGILAIVALAGCSGNGDSDRASTTTNDVSSGSIAEPAPAPDDLAPEDGTGGAAAADAPVDDVDAGRAAASTVDLAAQARSVIATGTVNLRAEDVGQARTSTRKVIDAYRGEIAESEIETDRSGELTSARLVLRIPTADFTEAITDLEAISKFNTVQTGEEDVTTQVIDVEARVRAQEKSLARVGALLAEANTFKDVVAIESQLTTRQAELESLKSQRAWLSDQTSMSTITVYLERLSDEDDEPADDSDLLGGFMAGLRSGWGTLGGAVVGFATVIGALLPFALAVGIVGVPLWLVGRRVGRAFALPLASLRSARPQSPVPSGAQESSE
jgi:predicted lipid-binding transport protein (Tim44 family)